MEYPDPVPDRPDVRVRESAWGPWRKTDDTCQRITTPNNNNSNDDDDDDNSLSPPPRNTNNDDGGSNVQNLPNGQTYNNGNVEDRTTPQGNRCGPNDPPPRGKR